MSTMQALAEAIDKRPLNDALLRQFQNSNKVVLLERFRQEPANDASIESIIERNNIQPILWQRTSEMEGRAISLQKWEGVVIEVKKDIFYARLYDLTATNPEEEAEFFIEEVCDDDLELIQPGAVFYWSIGYFTDRTGQRKRASILKFRRLPTWTKNEIEAARLEASRLGRLIGWGNADEAAEACAG